MAINAALAGISMTPGTVPGYIPIGELIANGDLAAGNMVTLGATVNSVPFEPSQLGSRGIFEYTGSLTRTVAIEFDGQVINIVQSTAPGAPPVETELKGRVVKQISAPRIAKRVNIMASEIAAYRQLGGTALATIRTQTDRKLQNAVRDIRATLEFHRVGGIVGKVSDADGTQIQNYFSLLGVSQPTYDVTFATAGTQKFIQIAADLLNLLEDSLGNLNGVRPPIVFCGRNFFKRFVSSADVVLAYQYFQAVQQKSNPLRDDIRYDDFEFGGIIWRQYRGGAANIGKFIDDNSAYLVPQDVPGMFQGYFCPPDDILDMGNTVGQPIYPTVYELPDRAGYRIQLQSNPLHVNARPGSSIKLLSSN